ncbi:MAG: YggU family protein [Propionivibrio sp.]|nr:YggU family protein [Propionivibrio sp.]
MTADWLRESGGRTTLTLHIQPGAKKTEVAGLHGDALKIRLAAPPVDGKANAALLSFVAERLGIAKSSVSLKSGQTSRRKVLEVDAAAADIAQRLLPES